MYSNIETIQIKNIKVPAHIAIIMDGNRRWAQSHAVSKRKGHEQGVEALKSVIAAALDTGVAELTVFGFSLENWKRKDSEIQDLFWVMRKYLKKRSRDFVEKGVKISIIGSLENFDEDLVKALREIEDDTKACKKLKLNIALGYGAKQDILQAVNRAILSQLNQELTEEQFAQYLWSKNLPEVDLLIRTSGEYRISNFLLWQIAYAEMYYTATLWPDFDGVELKKAIEIYSQRERRFGADCLDVKFEEKQSIYG